MVKTVFGIIVLLLLSGCVTKVVYIPNIDKKFFEVRDPDSDELIFKVIPVRLKNGEEPVQISAVTQPSSVVLEGETSGDYTNYRIAHFIRINNPTAGVVLSDTSVVPFSILGQAALDSLQAGNWVELVRTYRKHASTTNVQAANAVRAIHGNLTTVVNNEYPENYKFFGTIIVP